MTRTNEEARQLLREYRCRPRRTFADAPEWPTKPSNSVETDFIRSQLPLPVDRLQGYPSLGHPHVVRVSPEKSMWWYHGIDTWSIADNWSYKCVRLITRGGGDVLAGDEMMYRTASEWSYIDEVTVPDDDMREIAPYLDAYIAWAKAQPARIEQFRREFLAWWIGLSVTDRVAAIVDYKVDRPYWPFDTAGFRLAADGAIEVVVSGVKVDRRDDWCLPIIAVCDAAPIRVVEQ